MTVAVRAHQARARAAYANPQRAALSKWAWLLLVAASPFFLFPATWSAPILFIAPLVIWLQAPAVRSTPLDVLFLVLAIAVLASALVTPDAAASLPKIAGLLLGQAVYFTVVRWAFSAGGYGWCLTALLAGGVAVAAAGLLGSSLPGLPVALGLAPDDVSGAGLTLGGIINPNEVAGALLWPLPVSAILTVALLARDRSLAQRAGSRARLGIAILAGLASTVMLVALVGTQSRGAYAGMLMAALAVLFAATPRQWRIRLGLAVIFATGIVTVVALVVAGPWLPPAWYALQDAMRARAEIWSRAIFLIGIFPISGLGLNMFRVALPALLPLPALQAGHDIGHAHNAFLQAALDLGVPGLVAFAGLYVCALWLLADVASKAPAMAELKPIRFVGVAPRPLTLALGGALVAHMVFGLTDAIALGAKPGVLFWLLLGLIAGLHRQVLRARPD